MSFLDNSIMFVNFSSDKKRIFLASYSSAYGELMTAALLSNKIDNIIVTECRSGDNIKIKFISVWLIHVSAVTNTKHFLEPSFREKS